jgi:hypothetical protein
VTSKVLRDDTGAETAPAHPEIDFIVEEDEFGGQKDIFDLEAIVAEGEDEDEKDKRPVMMGSEFMCRKVGRFAMPHDCSSFVVCDGGLKAHKQVGFLHKTRYIMHV